METLINIAGDRGLKSIYGFVLSDSSRMLKLMKEFGFTIVEDVEGEVKVVRQLS